MLSEMRPSDLGLWAALWNTDPWGESRADLRSAINTSVLANANRDPKKKPDPFTASDFMPYEKRETQGEDLGKRIRAGLLAASAASELKKKAEVK